jgi:hypothetical protein
MQGFRKYVLAVSLSAALVVGAGASTPVPHRHGSLDDSVIARVLAFFGIELHSRVSIPPG